MTGLLKDLMSDKADHAHAPRLDFDAIIEAGDKRVRRRRIATGAGVAAVAAAVVMAIAVVPGIVDDGGPEPVQRSIEPDFSAPLPTYATSSQIHYGSDEIDVSPLRVSALARTDQGFVYTSSDDAVYFTDGEVNEQIGTAAAVAGRTVVGSGSYAAWIDPSGETPELVVYNTADQAETLRTSEGSTAQGQDDPFVQTAVSVMDGSTLYWHNSNGVVVSDVAAGAGAISLMPAASSEWLFDAVDGVFARASFDDLTVTVSRETEATEPNFTGDFATLSPDASKVATANGDEVLVFDVASGDPIAGLPAGMRHQMLLGWEGPNDYVVAASPTLKTKATVFTCNTTSTDCRELAPNESPLSDFVAIVGS